MAQILFPLFSAPGDQILIPPITSPRAASVDDILAVANQLNIRAATVATVPKAVEIAVQSTVPHGIIVAAGSVYLAGAVRTALAAQGPRALEREEG
jgi:dihydrofolate synthase/folylpolyglutamate synthase